jgi:peroxidase
LWTFFINLTFFQLFKVLKTPNGIGSDILSLDIQRSRDQGLPTFLQVRSRCGLKADYKTFEDLADIFPQSYIDLLKDAYDSVEDIDLYVGGVLETFVTIDEILLGRTFGCIVVANYQKLMASDAYFFTHTTSPYPFTNDQKEAILATDFNQLICVNSGFETTTRFW